MKGIIVDIENQIMVVADSKGNLKRVRYIEGCRIGDEIDMSAIPCLGYVQVVRRIAAIAAVLVIMLVIGLFTYYTPYSYVTVDINPSIEIVLNRFDKVLDVKPLNPDAHRIVNQNKSYIHSSLSTVLAELIDKAYEFAYIREGTDSEIIIAVSAPRHEVAQQIGDLARKYAEKEILQAGICANILVEKVDIQKHKQAQKERISVGKLILFEKLKEMSPEVGVETVRHQSVQEIMSNIEKKGSEKDNEIKEENNNVVKRSEKINKNNKEEEKNSDKLNNMIHRGKETNENEIDKINNKEENRYNSGKKENHTDTVGSSSYTEEKGSQQRIEKSIVHDEKVNNNVIKNKRN